MKKSSNETDKTTPISPYAYSKLAAEEICKFFSNTYSINISILRYFTVYGPSGRPDMSILKFIHKIFNEEPITIYGDGSQKRDFTYVSDAVDAIIKAAKSNLSGKIFNVGSGKTVSVNRVVKLLGGKKIYIPKRPGEPDCTFADIKKIKKYLNWSPKISIEKGIKIIKENINYWKNAPIWTKDKIKIATKDWFKYLKK